MRTSFSSGTGNGHVFPQISNSIEGFLTFVTFLYPSSAYLLRICCWCCSGWFLKEKIEDEVCVLGIGMMCVSYNFQQNWRTFHISYKSLSLISHRICCWCCWGWFWKEKIEDEGGETEVVYRDWISAFLIPPWWICRRDCQSWENMTGIHLSQS